MSKGLNDGYYDVGTKDEFERLLGNDSAVSCKRNKKDDTADAETWWCFVEILKIIQGKDCWSWC